METIINTISNLKGVHHACIYQNSKLLATTFPDNATTTIAEEIVDQIFTALQVVERSYDEIYFSVGENLLAAFLLKDNHIAILLTDKKINLPLINMGVKSAYAKIQLTKELEKENQLRVASPTEKNNQPDIPKTNPDLDSFLEQLSSALMKYLGPAAPIVLNDCLKVWKQKHVQIQDNIPHLIELITAEIESENEKNKFHSLVKTMLSK